MIDTNQPLQEGRLVRFQKHITSPVLTLPLVIMAPIIFIWSNNWFMYSFLELSISLLALFLMCLLVFAVGKLVYPSLEKMINGRLKYLSNFAFCILFIGILLTLLELPLTIILTNDNFMTTLSVIDFIAALFLYLIVIVFTMSKLVHQFLANKTNKNILWLSNFLVCTLLLAVLLIYLNLPLLGFFNSPYLWQVVFTASFLYFIVMKHGFEPIRVFLILWLFMSTATWVYSATAAMTRGVMPDESEHVTFKEQPNIYLFVLESYHDLKTMRDTYDIDTEPLQSWASSHDFTIYENVYSNSDFTLTSMTDIFGMRLNSAMPMGNFDIEPYGRSLIGGGPGNKAYRILKENGYHVVYLTGGRSFYHFHTKGKYLDETDMYLGPIPGLRPLHDGSFPFFNRIYTYFGVRYQSGENGRVNNLLPKFSNKLIDNIKLVIEESKDKYPLFIGFKSGANHANNWLEKDEWIASRTYQKLVKQGNQELFEIVDLIVDKDPSAVIILVGDHGSARLRGIENNVSNGDITGLDEFLKQHGESLDTLASDAFGTFLAIRMPEKGDISNGLPMSHVNLFRHVFATLADDDTDPNVKRAILERRAPSESHLAGFKLVKDGIVQYPEEP
jgi:hypothetical protein